MQDKTIERLLIFSIFFMAYWFFGNMYEEIVMIPNQLYDTYNKMSAYQQYFTVSNPVFYFVPITQMAVITIWVLYFKSNHAVQKNLLKKASIWSLLAIVLTAVIVTQINLKLFAVNYDMYKNELYTLSMLWLTGNAVRIFLVGMSLYYLCKAFIQHKVQMATPA